MICAALATLPTAFLLHQILNKSPINFFGPKSRSSKYRLPAANFPNKFRVTKFYEILAALPLNSRILYFTCKSRLHFVKRLLSVQQSVITEGCSHSGRHLCRVRRWGQILSSWAGDRRGEERREPTGQPEVSGSLLLPLTSY